MIQIQNNQMILALKYSKVRKSRISSDLYEIFNLSSKYLVEIRAQSIAHEDNFDPCFVKTNLPNLCYQIQLNKYQSF